MKTSDSGLKFIMNWEGTVLKPYKDIAGILTIGCGHVIRPGESFTMISQIDAMELLRHDLAIAESGVTKFVKVELTQQMFDALVSFVFNLGEGALSSSTLLKKLNCKDFAGCKDEFLKWCKAKNPSTGQLVINQGLLNRRKSESELFASIATNDDQVNDVKELSPEEKSQLMSIIAITTQHLVDEVIDDSGRIIPDDVA